MTIGLHTVPDASLVQFLTTSQCFLALPTRSFGIFPLQPKSHFCLLLFKSSARQFFRSCGNSYQRLSRSKPNAFQQNRINHFCHANCIFPALNDNGDIPSDKSYIISMNIIWFPRKRIVSYIPDSHINTCSNGICRHGRVSEKIPHGNFPCKTGRRLIVQGRRSHPFFIL